MDSRFSFRRGFMQVKNKDLPAVKKEIMSAIGIETRAAWLNRLNGKVEPKVSEAKAIESVFKKYGIINVWGDMTKDALKDCKSHLRLEIQELVHFAYMMLGNDGLDRVINEVTALSAKIKSGTMGVDEIVEMITD